MVINIFVMSASVTPSQSCAMNVISMYRDEVCLHALFKTWWGIMQWYWLSHVEEGIFGMFMKESGVAEVVRCLLKIIIDCLSWSNLREVSAENCYRLSVCY